MDFAEKGRLMQHAIEVPRHQKTPQPAKTWGEAWSSMHAKVVKPIHSSTVEM
jgi:hypothetical protein